MNAVLELLHTCLSFCGCFCLEEEFWQGRRTSERGTARSPGALAAPRPQAFSPDVEERLLDPAEAAAAAREGSVTGSARGGEGEAGDDGRGGLLHAASSSSEEMYRISSFNTKVAVLRSTSPFYRSQQAAVGQLGGGSGGGAASGGGGSGGGGAGSGVDIELKPTPSNMLLGQAHLEQRGRFVDAHPVLGASSAHTTAHAAGPVRRGSPSPQLTGVAG
ncbi:hypothetical protein ABPG75_011688 [Micractinium tetrahymenae]